MAMATRPNRMATNSKVTTNMAKRMDWAHLNGMMDKFMWENSITTTSTELELTRGLMAASTKVTGE